MFQTDFHTYIYALHAVLIFSTASIVFVIFSLQSRDLPAASIRLFKIFFVFSVIGWILLAARDLYGPTHHLIPPGTMFIVSSFLLMIAVTQPTENLKKILAIGLLHIIPLYANFQAQGAAQHMMIVSVYSIIAYGILFYVALQQARRLKNTGNGIIAFSALMIFVAAFFEGYFSYVENDISAAYAFAFVSATLGFVLIGIGFLTSILIHDQKQLRALALNDPLTGVKNRRGLAAAMSQVLSKLEGTQAGLSVISIDIDLFKRINDTYGHKAGDSVLVKVSQLLQQNVRHSDLVARIGGEEFVIVLPEMALTDAQQLAEALRQKIEVSPFMLPDENVSVTASFGVASTSTHINFESLLKEADQRLYQAKHQGRNQVAY